MDMVLLDWTRMGKMYCLAGVVQQNGQLRVVRPLPAENRAAPVRNLGSASVPVAWTRHPGSVFAPVIWTAIGAGLQWGAALFDAPS